MRKRFKFIALFFSVLLLAQPISAAVVSAAAYDPELTESDHVLKGSAIYPSLVIDDFNTAEAVAAWQPGENTAKISFVTSILNGPGSVYEGAGALEQEPSEAKAYEWRTIIRDFDDPLDLSQYRFLAFGANSWGFRPGDYFVKVRLYNNDEVFESNVKITPDRWTTAFLDLESWEHRNHITKMDISFMFNFDLEGMSPGDPGYDSWGGRFQIDYITATNVLDFRFNHDGITEGFTAVQGTVEAAQGVLAYAPAAAGSYLESPILRENIDQRNTLTVRLKNQSPAEQLKLSWITEEQGVWEEKLFPIAPNSGSSINYDFNLSDRTGWSGHLKQFRLEPIFPDPDQAGGLLEIDEFEFNILPELIGELYGKLDDVRIIGQQQVRVEGGVNPDALAAHPGAEIVLYELPAYESFSTGATGQTAIASQQPSEHFVFDVSLYDGERSRLFSKFFVALKDGDQLLPVDIPKYIVNPDALAENRYPFPEPDSIKGLQVQFTDDAEELGIRHAALNVAYDNFLYKDYSHPSNTIVYNFNGENFYIKKDRIERLDRDIKSLSDIDAVVSLILILYRVLDPETPNDILLHPDSEPGGTVYAFNTKTAEGVKYFTAFTSFLAERYTRADEKYGRAVNFIVGNEIGQNKVWNNMGPKLIYDYVEDYARTLRMVDAAVRSHYDKARVYVSLDHFWDEDLPSTSLWKYDNRRIIDLLTEHIRSAGDLPWNIAFHPYPENLFDAEFWKDESPTFDFETDRITFKNLEVLVEYMQQEPYLFNGEMRRIILSEQGFHSPNTPEGQLVQAAAYAYAYYKIKFLDGIDSFILHRHVDHAQEGGLNLGLWTNLQGQIATPDLQKKIYDVFKYIDTERSLEVTEFAKSVIGIHDWVDVIPGFDPTKLKDRELPVSIGSERVGKAVQFTELSGFEAGTDGWMRADNASGIELNTDDSFSGASSLQVNFSELAKMWRGADLQLSEPVDATAAPYLTLALKPLQTNAQDSYFAKVKVYSGSSTAESIIPLRQGEWNHAALNLSGWDGIGAIDRIKVWMNSPTNDIWNGAMLIDAVGFSKTIAPDGGHKNFSIAAEVQSGTLEEGAQILVTVTNYDAAPMTGDVEIEPSEIITFSENKLHVNKIQPGESRMFTLTVTGYHPPESGEIKAVFKYRASSVEVVLGAVKDTGEGEIPGNEELLYNFESGTQGWAGASNIENAGVAESFPNGPSKPVLGGYVFNARSAIVAADAWRLVAVTPEQPLDLSLAQAFFYHIDSYGGIPGASYETRVTLYSGNESIAHTSPMNPDQWNRIEFTDLADWPFKNSVTKIEIGFRAAGSNIAWNPEFQLDYIGIMK